MGLPGLGLPEGYSLPVKYSGKIDHSAIELSRCREFTQGDAIILPTKSNSIHLSPFPSSQQNYYLELNNMGI